MMKKTKRALVILLIVIMTVSTSFISGCARKKATIELIEESAQVEVGEEYTIKGCLVKDKDGVKVVDPQVTITVHDPNGDVVYVENDMFDVDTLGDYAIEYKYEDVTKNGKVTGIDTTAPKIVKTENFKSDVFAGDKVNLPMLVTEDASGVASTTFKVYVNDDSNTVVTPDENGEWIADNLNGYKVIATVTDKAGLTQDNEIKIRVTEKWLDTAHLKDRELATFGQEEYLQNVKAIDDKFPMKFEYVTEGVPAANTDSNSYGSVDGKALRITLPENGTREWRWVRIWLPKPIERKDFYSVHLKMNVNEAFTGIWWHNQGNGNPDAEGAWDTNTGAKANSLQDLPVGKWGVVGTPSHRFYDGENTYGGSKKLEYIDLKFILDPQSTVAPVAYIDEIFYMPNGTDFADSDLADKTVADFNEVEQGGEGKGALASGTTRKYDDTIRQYNPPTSTPFKTGNRPAFRWFVPATSDELVADTAKADGNVLKVIPYWNQSVFLLYFPTNVTYVENGEMSINIFVPAGKDSNVCSVRGIDGDNTPMSLKTSGTGAITPGQWNTVTFSMSIFKKDVSATNKTIKAMYIYVDDPDRKDNPIYFDNIKVTGRVVVNEPIIIDEFNNSDNVEIITDTAKVTSSIVTEGLPANFTGGALKLTFSSNAGGLLWIKFKTPVEIATFNKITIKTNIKDSVGFFQVAACLTDAYDKDTQKIGDNATGLIGWGVNTKGDHNFSVTSSGSHMQNAAVSSPKYVYGFYMNIAAGTATQVIYIDSIIAE